MNTENDSIILERKGVRPTANRIHIHFYCEVCHRTFCFKTIHVPGIDLPGGFTVNSINYMAKGICPECSGK